MGVIDKIYCYQLVTKLIVRSVYQRMTHQYGLMSSDRNAPLGLSLRKKWHIYLYAYIISTITQSLNHQSLNHQFHVQIIFIQPF